MSKVNCFIIVLLGLILGACGDDKKTGAPLSGVTSQFTAFAPENAEEEMLIRDFIELIRSEGMTVEYTYKIVNYDDYRQEDPREALEMTVEKFKEGEYRRKQTYTYFIKNEKSRDGYVAWKLKFVHKGENCIFRKLDKPVEAFYKDTFFDKPDQNEVSEDGEKIRYKEYCDPKGLGYLPFDKNSYRDIIYTGTQY